MSHSLRVKTIFATDVNNEGIQAGKPGDSPGFVFPARRPCGLNKKYARLPRRRIGPEAFSTCNNTGATCFQTVFFSFNLPYRNFAELGGINAWAFLFCFRLDGRYLPTFYGKPRSERPYPRNICVTAFVHGRQTPPSRKQTRVTTVGQSVP